jgi:ribosome-associated protein
MKGRKKEKSIIDTIVEAIQEKKGKDIVVIDLSALNGVICDYFVICHGDSNVHVEAVSDSVIEYTKKQQTIKPHHMEGTENSQWILMDYLNVVVHVFQKPFRDFYNLEGLWADGKMRKIENM